MMSKNSTLTLLTALFGPATAARLTAQQVVDWKKFVAEEGGTSDQYLDAPEGGVSDEKPEHPPSGEDVFWVMQRSLSSATDCDVGKRFNQSYAVRDKCFFGRFKVLAADKDGITHGNWGSSGTCSGEPQSTWHGGPECQKSGGGTGARMDITVTAKLINVYQFTDSDCKKSTEGGQFSNTLPQGTCLDDGTVGPQGPVNGSSTLHCAAGGKVTKTWYQSVDCSGDGHDIAIKEGTCSHTGRYRRPNHNLWATYMCPK